eukprot:gene6972-9532_t
MRRSSNVERNSTKEVKTDLKRSSSLVTRPRPVSPSSTVKRLNSPQSNHDDSLPSTANNSPNKNNSGYFKSSTSNSPMNGVFKKAIVGDIFGSHTNSQSIYGFLYRTRVSESNRDDSNFSKGARGEERKADGEMSIVDSNFSSVAINDSDSGSDNEFAMLKQMSPKQQLVVTIKNWSANPENDYNLIHEGAVYAMIALSSIDDSLIRRCCASTFYQLSSRPKNRQELLNIGSTSGVIILAQSKSWIVAKLCALTLCNLSMEKHGEARMAKEGAILTLAFLLQLKGQNLLPICVQTLYNLTCADNHFKGVDRIIKALLNISSSTFDHSDFLVKSLVNCSRYSWMRLRIIEDGAINFFQHSLIPTLATRANADEIAFEILVALRSLSDSSGCRADLLQKGSVDILYSLLPYSHENGRLLIIKILHNFFQTPSMVKTFLFETATSIVIAIVNKSTSPVIMQYCAACVQIFTKEGLRGLKDLAVPIIDVLSILLKCADPLTQYFSISSSGNLFFNNLCNNWTKIEQLVQHFITTGHSITDPAATQALALALAKMSQENTYITVIEKMRLLNQTLELLLLLLKTSSPSLFAPSPTISRSESMAYLNIKKINPLTIHDSPGDHDNEDGHLLLQESCCIAICRFSLRIGANMDNEGKRKIANVYLNLLKSTNNNVLKSTFSAIFALGCNNFCQKELLSPFLINAIADIISHDGSHHSPVHHHHHHHAKHNSKHFSSTHHSEIVDKELCRIGCGVLAVFSFDMNAHLMYAEEEKVMKILFLNIQTEDTITKEFIATTLCNISINPTTRIHMIQQGVVEMLATLSNSTSEIILELCAKCISNLTCQVNLQHVMIKEKILDTIQMISLVRCVSYVTKVICAKALLNLITDDNIAEIHNSSAVRVFSTLSSLDYPPIQRICSKGFYLLSLNQLRRAELVFSKTILSSVYNMIKCSSGRIKIKIGIAVCNLLSCPQSNKAAIRGGAFSIMKIIATMDFEELRETTARVIINLSQDISLQETLLKEPIVQILVLILQQSNGGDYTFECAIFALSCLSQSIKFRLSLINNGCIPALMSVIFTGKVISPVIAEEILRCICHLSYVYDRALDIISS